MVRNYDGEGDVRLFCQNIQNKRGVITVGTALAVFGGIWRYLAVFGGIWRYLAVFGGIWRYLAVFGGIWRYLAVFGGIWYLCVLCVMSAERLYTVVGISA